VIATRPGRPGLLPVSNNRYQAIAREFEPYYNPKIITSLFQNTAKTTAVTIADPVRVMSDLNGSIDAIAPSDAARPLYARSPKSGIRNLAQSTEAFADAYWTKACSNATAIPVCTDNFATAPNGSMTASRVQLTLPGDTEWATVRSASLSLAQPVTESIWLCANGAGQVGKKVNYYLFDGSLFSMGTATLTADWQRVNITRATGTIQEIGFGKHRTTNGGATNADTSTDFLAWGIQFELGATATAYQRVGTTRADITESGVDSAFSLLFDGSNDYLDTGVQSFGSASLFADAGQQWALVCNLQTNLDVSRNIISKCGATEANQTFTLRYIALVGLRTTVRGTVTTIANTASLGRYNACILNWDGTTLNTYVNSLTPVVAGVGAATEEAQNIILGARTASSPANFFQGRLGQFALIDRSLTTAEIASVMRYLASESGAVIS